MKYEASQEQTVVAGKGHWDNIISIIRHYIHPGDTKTPQIHSRGRAKLANVKDDKRKSWNHKKGFKTSAKTRGIKPRATGTQKENRNRKQKGADIKYRGIKRGRRINNSLKTASVFGVFLNHGPNAGRRKAHAMVYWENERHKMARRGTTAIAIQKKALLT